MKTNRKIIITLSLIFAFSYGCADLEIENLNNPDFETAVSNPSDVQGIAGGLFNRWFMITHEYSGPALGFWVAADAGTCSWGNAGMRLLGTEPRLVFNNQPTYEDAQITESFYNGLNSMLSQANDVLIKIENEGMVIEVEGGDNTDMVRAVAYMGQGLALGYLGLVYDKAFIIDHETDLTGELEPSPYGDVISAAMDKFDEAISIAGNSTFTLPGSWLPLGVAIDQDIFAQLANSFAARILAYSPRNASENSALDWSRVETYASNGIDFDFAPIADDITWYSLYHIYANYTGWGQVDMRVINMMDPDMPARWPGANGFDVIPAPEENVDDAFDNRIVTDYMFLSSCPFAPERGYYFFSSYRYKRRDTYLTTWTEPMPDMLKAENDMLLAEALYQQNQYVDAAAVINAGTRVTRGGLPEVPASAEEIEAAIFHERNVELMNSGFGVEFFTLRKADKLQEGTFLHLPIPGSQLQVLLMDYYTFGADQGTPGQDVSAGGWD